MYKRSISSSGFLFICIIVMFIFQNPLERIWHGFSYIDEMIACLAVILLPFYWGTVKKLCSTRKILFTCGAFLIFVMTGLLADFLFNYQPVEAVIVDLLVNVKFYMGLLVGYFLVNISWEKFRDKSNFLTRFLSVFLFTVWIVDRVFNKFGGEVRYNLRSSALFYSHPTYFAGTLVLLLAMLAIFYHRNNMLFIAIDIIMLFFTLRSKAIAATVIYVFLFWYILIKKKKLKLWQIMLTGIGTFIIAWQQIYFYYIRLAGQAARSVMTITSFKILKEYFPIGTGFGTYASHVASQYYSPVYIKYGFLNVWELSPDNRGAFFDDTFWPIIIGQTGFIGLCAYIFVLLQLIIACLRLQNSNLFMYAGAVFILAYLLISSTAEPAFNNSVAMPLAFLLGVIFRMRENPDNEKNIALCK